MKKIYFTLFLLTFSGEVTASPNKSENVQTVQFDTLENRDKAEQELWNEINDDSWESAVRVMNYYLLVAIDGKLPYYYNGLV